MTAGGKPRRIKTAAARSADEGTLHRTGMNHSVVRRPMGRRKSRYITAYLMLLPAVVLVFIFSYLPIYGVLIAFKDYDPFLGVMGSPWVGGANFRFLFEDPYFAQLIRNTLAFSLYGFLAGFCLPLVFALMINEAAGRWFKSLVQTVSYMPFFVSTVVICGMVKSFLSYDGVLNSALGLIGAPRMNLLSDAGWFRPICAITTVWQTLGWNSIIYLAAISGVDRELIDAARIDGCRRHQLTWHVTLPGTLPTVMTMFILSMGTFVSAPTELILLLYTPLTYETGDVLGTYIYRIGILGGSYEIAATVGLISNVISMMLLILFNRLSRAATEQSLW